MLKVILILLFLLFVIIDIFVVCGNSIKELVHIRTIKEYHSASLINNSEIK